MDKESENKYGNCDGPNSKYIKLISSDGFEFIIKREYALLSSTIKAMLSGPGQFAEMEANEIHFRSIPSHVLGNVCTYFVYKDHYTKNPAGMVDFNIEPEISLELLMAANFLDC